MLKKKLISLIGILAVFVLACGVGSSGVHAQESRGEVVGKVIDPTGAVIVGATVTIVNTASEQKLTGSTNGAGEYTINYVQPGEYTATVTASGFSTANTGIMHVDIGQRQQLNVVLKIGAQSQKVEVSALTPLLQTADASIGQVIDATRIQQLPLVNGSPYELVFVTTGFVPGPTGALSSSLLQADNLRSFAYDLAPGGTPHGSSEWSIDGVPNTTTANANYGTGLSISPPTDSVQEFRSEVSYDASVGHTSSFIVNAVLKTGGNQFHGSGYIYGRTPNLDANLWFNDHYPPGARPPVPDFTYHRYGGSFLGPIRIPKIYDGRNRTLFAWSGEYMSVKNSGAAATLTVPTDKEKAGDFTERLSLSSQPAGPNNPYTIYDPATIALVNGVYTIQPLQCNGVYNVICSNRVDKIGQALINLYPEPNAPGANNGTEANYRSSTATPDVVWTQMLRFDQTVTNNQRFYIRFGFMHRAQGPYRNFWNSPAVGNYYVGNPRQGVADYTWAIGSHFVTDFRYGFTYDGGDHTPLYNGYDLSSLGFNGSVISDLKQNGANGIPWIRTLLGNTFGGDIGQETQDYRDNEIHTFIASATLDYKRHTFKVGMDARAYRLDTDTYGESTGYFYFGGTYSGASMVNGALPSGSAIGASLATLLLGQPQAGYIDRNVTSAVQSTYWAGYIHDSWRPLDKLTVDLGLRYEYFGPITDRFDHAVAGFDPNAHLSITTAASTAYAAKPDSVLPVGSFQPTGGLQFAGLDVGRRGFWQKPLGVFDPRFGYAWAFKKNVAIRGGFGIFGISNGQDGQASAANGGGPAYQYGFSNETQFVPTLNNGLSFTANLANPFPGGVTPISSAASQGVNTYIGNAIAFYQPNLKTPYAINWHQGVQIQLPSQTLIELDYQGSRGVKLELERYISGVPDAYLEDSPNAADVAYRNYMASPVANPFAGLLPGSALNGSTITRNQLVSPYPQFTSVQEWVSQGSSNYNSLTLRGDRRFANGITFQGVYTWSRSMAALNYLNSLDPGPHMSIGGYDRPFHLALTNVLELPFGKGHYFLGNAHGVLDRLVSGWQINNVYQFFSGVPISFGSNFIFNGNWSQVPMKDHPIISTGRQWFNTAGFDKANSALMGDLLRSKPIYYSNLRTGRGNQWNLAVFKRTHIVDSIDVEFRAEAFNVLNHPNTWPSPDATLSDATFGQVISNPLADPRVMQFGGRVRF